MNRDTCAHFVPASLPCEACAATVAALWEARAEIERLRETVRLADIDAALTTAEVNDLTTEVQRLRAALGANLCPYTAKGHAGDGTVTACVEAGVDAAHELERRGYELKHTHRVGFWVDGRCGYMVSGGYFDTAQRACETAWERVQEAEANDSDPAWKFPTPNVKVTGAAPTGD